MSHYLAPALSAKEQKRFTKFQENFKQYSAKRREYRRKYPYQFVAVLNGKIILHTEELPDLFKRLRDEFKADLGDVIIDQL